MADERTTAQVHPEKLTHALLDHAKENGAKVEIGTVQGLRLAENGSVEGGTLSCI